MKLTSHSARPITVAAITGAAIFLAVGLTPASTAATAGLPASAARPPHPVIAYVAGAASPGAVTLIRTATNTLLKPITVGFRPVAIAITPDGKTVYVANPDNQTVTPIRTATATPLKPVKVADEPVAIAITPQ